MPKRKIDPLQARFRGRKPADETKVLDTTPMELPAGYTRPRPLSDVIAQMVREAIEVEKGEEYETPEEADDFDMDDEDLMLDFSPYELTDLTEEEPLPKPTLRANEQPETQQEAPQEEITPPEEHTPPEQVENA